MVSRHPDHDLEPFTEHAEGIDDLIESFADIASDDEPVTAADRWNPLTSLDS